MVKKLLAVFAALGITVVGGLWLIYVGASIALATLAGIVGAAALGFTHLNIGFDIIFPIVGLIVIVLALSSAVLKSLWPF